MKLNSVGLWVQNYAKYGHDTTDITNSTASSTYNTTTFLLNCRYVNSGIVFKRIPGIGIANSNVYNLDNLSTGQEQMVTNMQSSGFVTFDSSGTGSQFVFSNGGNPQTSLALGQYESATFLKVSSTEIVCVSTTGKFS